MKENISVVVVNYNSGDLLHECITSILQSSISASIIIVDNASSDHSLESIAHFDLVTIIKNKSNLGFSVACNIGLRHSSCRTILFLNPDCVLNEKALELMQEELYSQPDIGMVGGLLLNQDGSEQAGGRRMVPTPWRSFTRAVGLYRFENRWPSLFKDFYLHLKPLPSVAIDVEAISGACMLIRKSDVELVGEWDEGYFLHCEDLDWCMRFRKEGKRVRFVPKAKVFHVLSACSRKRPIFVEWHKHKGMVRFYRKFFRHQYPLLLMYLVIAGVWLRFSIVALKKVLFGLVK